ncbi:MAG TPA: ADOP family duplicated permease, partial [Longimicrobiales bacterium]|nr:ADOP family duplicated permease [Longimicrobiales bacterium]
PDAPVFINRAQVYVPLAWTAEERATRNNHNYLGIAKLRSGIDVARAQADMSAISKRLEAQYPDDNKDWGALVRPLQEDMIGGVRTSLLVLLGAVALVLLICCANVANLLLARAAAREREIAIRYSLGAHRRTVVRQLLVESLLVALAGGAVGLLLALWLADLLISVRPANGVPVYFDVRPDPRVLGFTFVVSLVTGLLFGLAPALQSSRATLLDLLKGERTFSGHRQGRLRDLLVAGQVAIALVLAIGAGLLVRTVQSASRIDAGFDPENVLVATVDLGTAGYDEPRAREFYRALRARLEPLPDVHSTALAARIPLAHPGGRRGVRIPDYTPQPGEDMEFPFNVVSADYFEVMQVPIDRGRAFTQADRADAQPVIIVNETFARRFWPGQDPIGKQMSAGGGDRTTREVIGVARAGKYWQINEAPRPYFYLPYEQSFAAMTLHVRARGNLDQVREAVHAAVRALDPQLPVLMLDTMEGQMARAVMPQRIAGLLVGLFAFLAILLAAIGVYGVTSVLVAQRVPELGLRIALGAGSREILSLIVGRAMLVAGSGVLAGLLIGAVATRALESMLFGISRFDPPSFVAAAMVLTTAALLAGYLPARRALRVDPLIALKS